METVYFLDLDHSKRELFVMKQRADGDARIAAGPFRDHAPAATRMEDLAHKLAAKVNGTAVFTVVPSWAQSQDGPQFSAHSCWLVRHN